MTEKLPGCPAGAPNRVLLTAMVLATSLVVLSTASPAVAVPKGEYASFADCPLGNPAVTLCIYAKMESGAFIVGKKTIPVTKPMIMQFGTIEKDLNLYSGADAVDGNTLSRAPQPVPGGLLGVIAPGSLPLRLRNIFEGYVNKGNTVVTATTELAAPANAIVIDLAALIFEEGPGLTLPVKVKLDNAFLGKECYIGSNAHPLTLQLTDATTTPPAPNKPIKGNFGTLSFRGEAEGEGEIDLVRNNTLVESSFAAPGASGCAGPFSFLVDPALNAALGLPSTKGHNTAILNSTMELTRARYAKTHE